MSKKIEIKKTILGINRRNQTYLRAINDKRAKQIADNKLLTKRVLRRANIPTPEVFKVIRTAKQLEYVDWHSLPKSFVIKPNQGSRGRGIAIFYGRRKNTLEWIRPNGTIASISDIKTHIHNIFEGRYSLGERKDVAIIEERLKNDKTMEKYSYKGVPDIRLIVYNKIPIMAAARFPTKESEGKANLHAGAIYVGIDIATGITTNAIHLKSKSIFTDTYEKVDKTFDLKENVPVIGVQIPHWTEILEIAIKCQIEGGLGYAGVDIALDRDKGPMVFELNCRPGLGIQVANMTGLDQRLKQVEALDVKSIRQAVFLAKNLFGSEVSEEVEKITGKQIVNLVEKITLYGKTKERSRKKKVKTKQDKMTVKGLLDTGVITSRIDKDTLTKLGFLDEIRAFEKEDVPKNFPEFSDAQKFIDENQEVIKDYPNIVRLAKIVEDGKIRVRPVIRIRIEIRDIKKDIEAIVSTRKELIYPILLGRSELKDYLIDTSKTFAR